jgi:hypothetical protein
MSKATQRQLEVLANFEISEWRDMTSEEAIEKIDEMVARGVKMNHRAGSEAQLGILQFLKQRDIEEFSADSSIERTETLESIISKWDKEIEDWKHDYEILREEYLETDKLAEENKKEKAERDRELANNILNNIEYFEGYGCLSRKPTLDEIVSILEPLNWKGYRLMSESKENLHKFVIASLLATHESLRSDKLDSNPKSYSGVLLTLLFFIILGSLFCYAFSN